MSKFRSKLVVLLVGMVMLGGLNCSSDPDDANNDEQNPSDAGEVGDADEAGDAPDGGPSQAEAILGVEETDRLTIPALRDEVHVVRTEADVPHIYASNRHDLYLAEGYVLARDRYFEFEMAQRLARGRLSELLGSLGVDSDIRSRGLGMTHVAERIHANLDEETGAAFDAYAAGINAYIDAVEAGTAAAPSELDLVGPLIGAESPSDLMHHVDRENVAGFAAYAVFTSSHSTNDLVRDVVASKIDGHFDGAPDAELRQAGLAEDLHGHIDPIHPISVSGGWGLNGGLQQAMSGQTMPGQWLDGQASQMPGLPASMHSRILGHTRALETLFGRGQNGDSGSNAWAVGGDSSADGSTLLAGDGHLSLGIPSIFYQMGLDTSVFSEDDDLSVMGLFLTGFPFLAVGTNGHVAWSQTYPRADVTDWYREEIQLDADGYPSHSRFDGQWRELERVEETYEVAGVLGGEEHQQTWARWKTFDGRWITEIEGESVDPDEADADDAVVTMLGEYVVPGDTDGDGVITAISSDYTGYDIGDLAGSVAKLQEAKSVEEFQNNVQNFVGYAQNMVSADADGHIGFTPYTATPCRGYLPKDDDGQWVEGANPLFVLDGTRFGAFEVPLDDQGRPDPDAGADDPQRCIIPSEDFPQSYDPDAGYVANANNDPAGATFNDSLTDDPWYIGGPWVPGYRARAITTGLSDAIDPNETGIDADIDGMARIQGHHGSQVGEEYAPVLTGAIEAARQASDKAEAEREPFEERLAAVYDADSTRIDEVEARLEAWLDAGAQAESGVETFYDSPSDEDVQAAVATMIFNSWFRHYIAAIFADEQIDFVFEPEARQRGRVMRAMRKMVEGRGDQNPLDLASWNAETGESIFFDNRDTPYIERSDEIALAALDSALAELSGDPAGAGKGGFGTDDMDAWLWGLRHQVRFESILAEFASGNAIVAQLADDFAIDTERLPLADDIPEGDPREDLRWFPRHGDLFGVDAANPAFFGDDYDYSTGPVMRMVIALDDGEVRGQNIIPGGQSALTDSPHFDDQAALWLGNDTLPMRFSVEQVVEGATGREVLAPE